MLKFASNEGAAETQEKVQKQKGCSGYWVDRSWLINECISAAQFTVISRLKTQAFMEEVKERQFPVWKFTGLCVWLFLPCGRVMEGPCMEGGFFSSSSAVLV